jgi:alpha-L-fucosidase
MTMNESWGFHRTDTKWKSTKTLIQMLAETASKGGNLLLNVGPTELGEIPPASVERLKAMGAWMHVNSSSIYETEAAPLGRLPWGRCTMKQGPSGSILFLHVFDWPSSRELHVPGLLNEVKRAYLLANPSQPLNAKCSAQGIVVGLPAQAPDANDSVVVLELIGAAAAVEQLISPGPDGSIVLEGETADLHGGHARYEAADDRRCIGFWTSDKDSVSWDIRVPKAGKYEVELEYSCEAASAGSEVKVEVGASSLSMKVENTGKWSEFLKKKAGTIDVAAGNSQVRVVPVKMARDAVMNLRSVRLKPAPGAR